MADSSESNTDNDSENKEKTPPKKRKYYQQIFLKSWETEFSWVKVGKNNKYAFCAVCRKDIKITAGKTALFRHEASEAHKSFSKSILKQSTINFPTTSQDTKISKTAYAEIKLAGFIAEHNIAISATEHMPALFQSMFPGKHVLFLFSKHVFQ